MPLLLTLPALALFATAAATDLRARRIPNRLTLALALLGLARVTWALAAGAPPLPLAADLAAAAVVFALATAGFAAGLLGGGDVKLLAAGTLWVGAGALAPYLLTTVFAGGVLALGFAALHFVARRRGAPAPSLPYGVAIAAGGILTTAGVGIA
jgi:prepilin peptidase CpaA